MDWLESITQKRCQEGLSYAAIHNTAIHDGKMGCSLPAGHEGPHIGKALLINLGVRLIAWTTGTE